ncbi:hypothetical protein BH10ACT1_BH10ACT1_42750 [soil metagenome]
MATRRGRWVRVVVVVGILAWLGVAAVLLLKAKTANEDARDALDRAQQRRKFHALIAPETGAQLAEAHKKLAEGHSLLSNPLLAPLKILPVVGRQVRAADRLDREAAEATDIARDALGELRDLSAAPAPGGAERLAVVKRLADVVERSERRLRALDLGTDKALIGPVQDARDEFGDKLDDAVTNLDRAGTLLAGMQPFLDGSNYLLLGANNAEMRAGSGMFLSATTLTTDKGAIELGDVRPTNQLILPKGVPTRGDLPRNWPWLDTGADLRNLALTPQFPVSAEIAARIWAAEPGGQPVDGVMAIDVQGLQAVLDVVGPVTVNGIQYSDRTIRAQLLNGQYAQFDSQGERTDQLGEVARQAFDRLEGGSWEVGDLATALIRIVSGRHLMVWSSDKVQQAGWEAASADGHIEEDSLAVSILNRGGNKLDYFFDVAADMTTQRDASGTDVKVVVHLTNRVPTNQPRYVQGPNTPSVIAGEYVTIAVANVPGTASDLRFTGGAYETLAGRDGPTQARGQYLRLKRGKKGTLTLSFHLPPEVRSVVLEPSARVPGTEWTFNGRTLGAEERRTLRW